MRMVIVGGGKVGWNLARIMLERRHNVSLIEKDRQRCERLADDLDAAIYRGDGTNVGVLEAAGAQNADVFMTVTGSDQDNLVAVSYTHLRLKWRRRSGRRACPGGLLPPTPLCKIAAW